LALAKKVGNWKREKRKEKREKRKEKREKRKEKMKDERCQTEPPIKTCPIKQLTSFHKKKNSLKT
jgi:hypothetical protein